jgi:hypothetical protein
MVVHMALAMARPWKHPKTGIYWLRKRVPDDLRPLLGKQEEKRSLGTRDCAEAKRLHAQALIELEQRWTNLRAPLKPISEREAHELVAPAYEWWINLHRDNPSEQTVWKTKFFDKLWTWPSKYVPLGEEILHWEEDGYFDRIAMEKFCRERVQDGQKLKRRSGRRFSGPVWTWRSSLKARLQRSLHSQPAISVAQHTPDTVAVGEHVTFESLIARWANDRRPMQKTIYEYKRVLGNLTDFLGHDDATRLSPKDLVAWKGKMIEAGLHPKTILGAKLAPVRAILQWGVDNDHLPSNPAARITIGLKTRAADSKRGFNDDEAATILTAANAAADPVKRWVPLLGAYSGARLSEICQLRVQDVAEVNGIWCMKILPEAGSLRAKISASDSIAPITRGSAFSFFPSRTIELFRNDPSICDRAASYAFLSTSRRFAWVMAYFLSGTREKPLRKLPARGKMYIVCSNIKFFICS